jgi:hypothetical protein
MREPLLYKVLFIFPFQPISHPADRADQVGVPRYREFAPEIGDIKIHHCLLHFTIIGPDGFQDLETA